MKSKSILTLVIIFLFFAIASAQKIDSFACKKIENHLEVIDKYLKNKNSDPSRRRVIAIEFLTILTGIPSESDGNYFGQSSPTQKDYNKWSEWYKRNRRYVYWDSKQQAVLLRKK